jgi:hypothetical protein
MINTRPFISKGSLIVWITSYVFFLTSLVNNFSASHDSIHYLNDIVHGTNLFHQHHLLYHFLANKWMLLWRGFVEDHYIIESFTALWGSSALTMIYLFFRRRFHHSFTTSLFATAVVAFSYGVWFYSTNIEVYLPPLFFILLCLYILTKKELSKKDIWQIALFHSLAILFHQVNILFTVVVLYYIIKNKMYSSLWIYAITGAVLVGGMYFIAGWFIEGHNSMSAWIKWMEGYTVGHGYWQPPSVKTPLHVITGFAHAFIGGHFIFQLPAVEYYFQHSFQSHGLKDEIFLSQHIDDLLAWVLTVVTVVVAVYLLVLIIRFIKKYRSIKKHYPVDPLLITLLVYSVFFCFWMPEILEFWILQMVIVWILLLGSLRTKPVIYFLPFAMLFINYYGSVKWLQSSKYDWYDKETNIIKRSITPGDLIIVDNEWILKDYLRYYTEATIMASDEPEFSNAIDKIISEKRALHKKVFIYNNGLKEFD